MKICKREGSSDPVKIVQGNIYVATKMPDYMYCGKNLYEDQPLIAVSSTSKDTHGIGSYILIMLLDGSRMTTTGSDGKAQPGWVLKDISNDVCLHRGDV